MYNRKYDLGQSLPGIYLIIFKDTEYVYIGSSYNVYDRLAGHLRTLLNNKHDNVFLQRTYLKYGKDKIRFIPLEYCEKDDTILQQKEVYWYNYLINKYKLINLVDPVRNTLPLEHRQGKRGLYTRTNTTAIGVSLTKSGKYVARLHAYNKYRNLGVFSSYEEATSLYKQCLTIDNEKDLLSFIEECIQKAESQRNKKHKYKGVYNRYNNCWIARIEVKRAFIWLGSYSSEVEAATVYNNYIIEHKLNRRLNIIDE